MMSKKYFCDQILPGVQEYLDALEPDERASALGNLIGKLEKMRDDCIKEENELIEDHPENPN